MAKKLLKKLGKAAALAGALYGATKLGRRRATDLPGNAMAKAKRLMTSDRAYTGGGYDDAIMRAQDLTEPKVSIMTGDPHQYRWPNKKGGRVTGAAKRGFGRALMKGKK
jgi:hypothetical protein